MIATILEDFHEIGKRPELIERLKSLVTDGAILGATIFSILAGISSGPVDFVACSVSRRYQTSSTVRETPVGTQSLYILKVSISANERGSME